MTKIGLQIGITIKRRPNGLLVCGLWVHYIIVPKDQLLCFKYKLNSFHDYTGIQGSFASTPSTR